jgi:hypothetical protein
LQLPFNTQDRQKRGVTLSLLLSEAATTLLPPDEPKNLPKA